MRFLHRLYAITAKVSPTKRSGGMELLETSTFKLQCYQTLTGVLLPYTSMAYITSKGDLRELAYFTYSSRHGGVFLSRMYPCYDCTCCCGE